MKQSSKALAAVRLAVSLPWFATSSLAAPIAAPPSSWRNAAAAPVETVQWLGAGWSGPGIELATGVIIGGAIAASGGYDYGYWPGYGYAPGYAYAPAYTYAPAYAPGYPYAPGYAYAPRYYARPYYSFAHHYDVARRYVGHYGTRRY